MKTKSLATMPDVPYQNTYCVARVNGTSPNGNPVQLWMVSLKRDRRLYARQFADSIYGGKESAWLIAVAYRDALMRLFPPRTQMEQRVKPRRNNTSGIPGVTAKHIHGKLTAWLASLEFSGVLHNRYFPVKEHGEETAKALAIAARQELLAQYPNRFVTINANATHEAEERFGQLLHQPLEDGDADSHSATANSDSERQRQLELLNAWFDAVRPQFVQLRLSVNFLTNKGHDCLYLVAGDGGPSGHKQRKSWSIQRRTYDEVLRLAWDYAQATFTRQFGSACWREFARLYEGRVLESTDSSTRERSILIRHRHEPTGHPALRRSPPLELLPMLQGFKIPALAHQTHPDTSL